jgi:flagellar biosynthesis protein FlhF
MHIKTFRAKSIQEALQLVRDSLGPDAYVHQTREVRGLIGRRLIEVEASGQTEPTNRLSGSWPDQNTSTGSSLASEMPSAVSSNELGEPLIASQLLDAELQAADSSTDRPNSQPTSSQQFNASSVGEQGTNASAISSNQEPTFSEWHLQAAQEILVELQRCGVTNSLAASLLRQSIQRCDPEYRRDNWLVKGQLCQLVAERLKVADPKPSDLDQQQMMAFVGPTGVGKTTLLGKIAAQAYRDSELQIGIVTVDTWRGAAVEQLLEFAELVQAQVEVVGSIEQLAPALQRLREMDLVLIDTAGRSPNDAASMTGLKELLDIAQPDVTHLVLNCNASETSVHNAIEKFQMVGATHLCISKLDEGSSLGHWLEPLWQSSLPVSHLTHGQDAEKDLIAANARHLASVLLGQSSLIAS